MGTSPPRSWLPRLLDSGLHCQRKAGLWWCGQRTQINWGPWLVLIPCTKVALVVKSPPASGRDVREVGSAPGRGRSPEEGNGHPQYSFLEKPTERGAWQATVHGVTKTQTVLKWLNMHVGVFMEKAMGSHSSTRAWKIPWMEEPGRLQSMGSLRVGCGWATSLSLFTFTQWRRKWQPTPVFLPGESQGRGSLVGCRLWGRTESDTTDAT